MNARLKQSVVAKKLQKYRNMARMQNNMKKSAQRRHKHCTLAGGGAKKFHRAADPLPRGVGQPKFNQLELVTTFTYKPSLVRINARNFELSW